MLKIALAGASSTGKSQLAADLTRVLQASGQDAFVVVAKTPALLAGLAHNDLTLLMGLSPFPTGMQEAEDGSIRAALENAGVPYQVMYGEGEERLAQALAAAQRLAPRTPTASRSGDDASRPKTRAWTWLCDKCSDPQCEHKLLTALLAQRTGAA